MVTNRDGNVLTNEENMLGRWEECFEGLMSEENERQNRLGDGGMVKQGV